MDSTPHPKNQLRRRIGPLVLAFAAVGVLFTLTKGSPVTVDIAYQVAPTLRGSPKNIRRVDIALIRTVFFDESGARIGVMTMDFPRGLKPPITHTGRITLAPGTYVARVEIRSHSGRMIERRQVLEVSEAAVLELPLK